MKIEKVLRKYEKEKIYIFVCVVVCMCMCMRAHIKNLKKWKNVLVLSWKEFAKSFNFEKVEKVWENEKVWERKILCYNINLHNVPFSKLLSMLNSDQNWASYSSLKFEKVEKAWES